MNVWIGGDAAEIVFITPFAAMAQDAPLTDDEVTEEIIVTAQKRATALQEVPFSVAALSSGDMQESGATNLVDVARNVPCLYIADLGPGQSQVAIRGISAPRTSMTEPRLFARTLVRRILLRA